MIPLVLVAMFLGLVTTASAQRRGPTWSPGGHGGTLVPGNGYVPGTTPGRPFWPNVRGRFGFPGRRSAATRGGIVVIPFPVYYSGNLDDGSGTDLPSDASPAQASTYPDDRPPVAIDQNLAPRRDASEFANHYPTTGREFAPPVSQNPANSNASAGNASAGQDTSNRVADTGKPTIYLIAFKDHRVVQALGYWIEGAMLHYVSVEYAFNHASTSLIDSDLSRRLNHERGIEFTIAGLE
jgi:hypothetical protein